MENPSPDVSKCHCPEPTFDVVALAASAGGLSALSVILSGLPEDFPAAIVIVQYLDPNHRSLMAEILARRTILILRQAQEGDQLCRGVVFIAPPDYHLLVNSDGTLSLTQSERIHFLRPSADLLFESLAASYKSRAIAVVLTGIGSDGSTGIKAVKKNGRYNNRSGNGKCRFYRDARSGNSHWSN